MHAYASHPLTQIHFTHACTYIYMHTHTHKLTHTCIQRGKSSLHRFNHSRSCKDVTYLKPLAKQGSELTRLPATHCWDWGCKPATARSPPPTHPPLPCTLLGTRSHADGQNGLPRFQNTRAESLQQQGLPCQPTLPCHVPFLAPDRMQLAKMGYPGFSRVMRLQ